MSKEDTQGTSQGTTTHASSRPDAQQLRPDGRGVISGTWTLVKSLRRPERAVWAAAFLLLFGMFASNTDWGGDPHSPRGDGRYRPVLARGDGHMTYLMLRSFVLDQDLVFDNDLARFGDPWRQRRTKTGRKDIPHPFGPILVWSPFMLGAHGLSKVANALGAEIPQHGYTMFHHRIVFGTSVLFAFLAVLLGAALARRYISRGWPPVYAAVAVLFGTSLTYYATYMPSYGHAMDAFFCALFLGYWGLSYGDLRWRRFVLLGTILGICALVRVQDLAMGIAVAVEVVALGVKPAPDNRSLWARRRWIAGLIGRGLVALAVALVVFSPQMIAWKLVYGEWLTSPNGPRYVRLGHPLIMELLFASRNGWLSTHPVAYAGVLGLLLVPRRARVIAAGLLAALVMQIWVNAAVLDWWASASFGQRRMCSVTLILVFGLAALIRACAVAGLRLRMPRWARHGLAVCVLGWFIAWNIAQVSRLRRGKAAGHPTAASCCGRVPKAMRVVAQPIYRLIGNPFALPASALFALRHDVGLRRWDNIAGDYVYVPPWYEYNNGRYKQHRAKWNIPSGNAGKYVLGGLGPPQKQPRTKRGYRWTTATEARMLVPILLPEAHSFTLRLGSNGLAGGAPEAVTIAMNGEVLLERELSPGWTEMTFVAAAADLAVGSNVLTVSAALHAHYDGSLPANPRGGEVGVAVGPLWVGFPRTVEATLTGELWPPGAPPR
jgi:hypothetical protein